MKVFGHRPPWISRSVVGIVLATFFSDFSHEMCTAVLPLYLGAIGLGPAALGMIEGFADFLVSIAKLAGGIVGQHIHAKRQAAAVGYLVTTLATAGMALVASPLALLGLRTAAWTARGFRSPLRDHLLADAVGPTHFGRAYGLERAGDMLGAVAGPLVAAGLVWLGLQFRDVLLWTIFPGFAAAASMFWLTRAPQHARTQTQPLRDAQAQPHFSRRYWAFVVGVFLFGLGDFSRTFLVWLVAHNLGGAHQTSGVISAAVVLYACHNLAASAAAYPIGAWGDRRDKLSVLAGGYAVGALTNAMLAIKYQSLNWLMLGILLSGIYISVEETLEKATAAQFVPREMRSLGFGILACANAIGDMLSSLYIGYFLENDRAAVGFGIAAFFGGAGFIWVAVLSRTSAVASLPSPD